jgi:hypothetical protein
VTSAAMPQVVAVCRYMSNFKIIITQNRPHIRKYGHVYYCKKRSFLPDNFGIRGNDGDSQRGLLEVFVLQKVRRGALQSEFQRTLADAAGRKMIPLFYDQRAHVRVIERAVNSGFDGRFPGSVSMVHAVFVFASRHAIRVTASGILCSKFDGESSDDERLFLAPQVQKQIQIQPSIKMQFGVEMFA